ncbi:MAG: hypothetical protein ACRDAG_00680, partial [Cetobacterium somerae]|uniref:hypothetical protein n=1 Tax=Cetobacterium somerae TaxID=188913 RepID=UPI003F341D31
PGLYNEDIINLTLFVKYRIENLEGNIYKAKNIIIIDDSINKIYGEICSSHLQKNYYVKILDIVKSYQIFEALNNKVDCIITLDSIEKWNLRLPFYKIDFENIVNNCCKLEKYGFFRK